MRQLKPEFIQAAEKINRKPKAESLEYTLKDLNNYRENYKTASEFSRNQIKAGFQAHGLDVETVTDNQINALAEKLINNKYNQIVERFQDYPIEKIFTMAQTTSNKMSRAFIEIEYGVKLPKTRRDSLTVLSDLWIANHESQVNPPIEIVKPEAAKVYKSYNLHGYEALIGPLRAGRLEAMLDDTRRKISRDGQLMSRREYIESMARNPKTEVKLNGEHIKWVGENLYSSRLNKSCGQYFEYLKSIWFTEPVEVNQLTEAEEARLFGGVR